MDIDGDAGARFSRACDRQPLVLCRWTKRRITTARATDTMISGAVWMRSWAQHGDIRSLLVRCRRVGVGVVGAEKTAFDDVTGGPGRKDGILDNAQSIIVNAAVVHSGNSHGVFVIASIPDHDNVIPRENIRRDRRDDIPALDLWAAWWNDFHIISVSVEKYPPDEPNDSADDGGN